LHLQRNPFSSRQALNANPLFPKLAASSTPTLPRKSFLGKKIHHLLGDEAREDKLVSKEHKLRSRIANVSKEIQKLASEREKKGTKVSEKQLEMLRETKEKTIAELNRVTTELSILRAEAFGARGEKETWISFVQGQ